jgi:lactose/cellobiose-specific phosphotransferase system IIC component
MATANAGQNNTALGAVKKRLYALTGWMESCHALRAVMRGLIYLIPLTVIMSFMLLALEFPSDMWQRWLAGSGSWLRNSLQTAYQSINSIYAVLLSVSIGFSCGREWGLPMFKSVMIGMLSMVVFGIFIGLKSEFMSNSGMFTCILSALFVTIVFFKIDSHSMSREGTLLRHVSPRLKDPIATIPTIFAVVLLAAACQSVISLITDGMTLQELIDHAVTRAFKAMDLSELGADIFFMFCTHFLWFFSLNGMTLLQGINQGYFGQLSADNAFNLSQGMPPDHIVSSAFNNVYLLIGGSGAMMGLVLAVFLVSQSRSIRRLAMFSLPCNCIGVSEIIAFGLPVVCNPIMLLPLLIVPQINLAISYAATYYGMVPVASHLGAWVLPVFFNAWYATESWSAVALQLILIIIDTYCFIPFVKLNEEHRQAHRLELLGKLTDWVKGREEARSGLDLSQAPQELKLFAESVAIDLIDDLRTMSPRLYLLYQPQFSRGGTCIGAEALLRWNNRKLGSFYPPLIIAIARMGGFLPELERKVFMDAARGSAMAATRSGRSDFKVSVNITGDALGSDDVLSMADDAVRASQIEPEMLWVEITEQDAFDSSIRAMERFDLLRMRGHKLLIDDFGMGHTSVRYLQTNTFDAVKLDGSITMHVCEDEQSRQIISSMTQMCLQMGMKVIAEYVENRDQRDMLYSLGCEYFQGYLYSLPVSLKQFSTLLKDGVIV